MENNNRNDDYPNSPWCVNAYLENSDISLESKVKKIVAFAYSCGIIQFEDGKTIFGDMNVLSELLQRGYIGPKEYSYYTHVIYDARNNKRQLLFD